MGEFRCSFCSLHPPPPPTPCSTHLPPTWSLGAISDGNTVHSAHRHSTYLLFKKMIFAFRTKPESLSAGFLPSFCHTWSQHELYLGGNWVEGSTHICYDFLKLHVNLRGIFSKIPVKKNNWLADFFLEGQMVIVEAFGWGVGHMLAATQIHCCWAKAIKQRNGRGLVHWKLFTNTASCKLEVPRPLI